MRLSQLSLYDFLADFLPGAIAVLLLSSLLWLLGFIDGPVTTGASFGLVLTGYPVGRTIHAVAGQTEVKNARSVTFDIVARIVGQIRVRADLTESDSAVSGEPSVVARFDSAREAQDGDAADGDGDTTLPNEWIDRAVVSAVTSDTRSDDPPLSDSLSALGRADIDWEAEEAFGQLQRFGFSELFDTSTLYQRYNIIETFYRNLWLVFAYFGLLYLTVAFFVSLAEPSPFAYLVRLVQSGAVFVSALAVTSLLTGIGLSFAKPEWRAGILRYVWYCVFGAATGVLGLGVPLELLLPRIPESVSLDPALFAIVGGLLLALAVLFDIRRVQFKRRQVRAFINDLYRQQHSGDDGDEPPEPTLSSRDTSRLRP